MSFLKVFSPYGARCRQFDALRRRGAAISLFLLLLYSPGILQAQPDSGSGEQTDETVFDLYLGDSLKGLTAVRFTDQWCEIEDPPDVIEQLSPLKDPSPFSALLNQRIFRSLESSDGVSVLCDPGTFRLVVKSDPKYLFSEELKLTDRIPDPENKFSLQQSVELAGVSTSDSENAGAFTHRTLLSQGKFYSKVDGTVATDTDYLLNEGFIGGVVDELALTSGYLKTHGQSFTSSQDFIGFGATTAEEIYLSTETDKLRGSKLEIFVPSRSEVRFFKDGRLLSVQILDFGLQEVNTAAFPQGSYDVEILIRGENGEERRERRFFTKSGLLGVRKHPVYFLRGGIARDAFDPISKAVYEGGTRFRAADALQLNLSFSGLEDLVVGDAEVLGLYKEYSATLGYALSNRDDNGIIARLAGKNFETNWDVSVQKALRGFDDPELTAIPKDPNSPSNPLNPFLPTTSDPHLFSGVSDYYSASVYRRFGDVELRLYTNRSTFDDDRSYYVTGPRLSWDIVQSTERRLRFQSEYLDTDRGKQANLFLTFELSLDKHLRWENTAASRGKTDALRHTARTSLNYDTKVTGGLGNRARISSEAGTGGDPGQETGLDNQIDLSHVDSLIASDLFARSLNTTDGSDHSVGVNARSSFVYTAKGMSVAPPLGNECLLIVEVKSNTPKSEVEVVLDGTVQDKIRGSGKTVITASPYRSYRLSIRPSERSELITLENQSEQVTFFPGNIVRRDYEVGRVIIGLGKVVDAQGEPIKFKRIKGLKEYVLTEEDGSFQAEMSGSEEMRIDSGDVHCKITLPTKNYEGEFHDFGTLVCEAYEAKN